MSYLPPTFIAVTLVFAAAVGACLGSFINCAALRRGTGASVLHGRSACPHCGHVLGARDLVPIASWLALRGRCRHCGAKIPVRYLVVELVAAVAFVLLVWRYGFRPECAEMLAFACILLYASLVDLDSFTIPNACVLAALAVRAAYIAYAVAFQGADPLLLPAVSLACGLALSLPLLAVVLIADRVFKRESMGFGDVKLFFVVGFYFGAAQGLAVLIIACVFGIVFGLLALRPDPQTGKRPSFPFGPCIAAACLVVMVAGAQIVNWYAGLL